MLFRSEMRVDQFAEVIFNDSAYDYLVMESEQKGAFIAATTESCR